MEDYFHILKEPDVNNNLMFTIYSTFNERVEDFHYSYITIPSKKFVKFFANCNDATKYAKTNSGLLGNNLPIKINEYDLLQELNIPELPLNNYNGKTINIINKNGVPILKDKIGNVLYFMSYRKILEILNIYYKSFGSVVVVGLGIGYVVNSILSKEEVTDLLVFEENEELIDVISPILKEKYSNRLTIINANINDLSPLECDYLYLNHIPENQRNINNIKEIYKLFYEKWFAYSNNIRIWLQEYIDNYDELIGKNFFIQDDIYSRKYSIIE